MSVVSLYFHDSGVSLECQSLVGHERLGEPSRFELTTFAREPITSEVLGKACAIHLKTKDSERTVFGIVTTFVSIGTSHAGTGRRYRLSVRSALSLLDFHRTCRVFQHLSVPAIIQRVVSEGGYGADRVELRLRATHPPREYVVQYMETDLTFIRRLCEEDGLYFRFEAAERADKLVLEDTSSAAPQSIEHPLMLVDDTNLTPGALAAFACRSVLERRPGKVTLRDYDPHRPSLALEGIASAGTDAEKGTEVYGAPGRFGDASEGKRRASLHLEALRAEARVFSFETTAIELTPGAALTIECAPDYPGTARPEGKNLVVGLAHQWTFEGPRYSLEVEAVPLDVPFRLPRITPRPHIAGIHSAVVTGARGEEIHPERDGRIHVRFHWDRGGPTDHQSSLPVRVAQPNMPGSMIIPRVGWEVFVVFEDGDPDRPYVIGRSYNGKQLPPFSLPANKTVTSVATFTSPGGGKQNSIHFDDAAGRQHVAIQAAFGKATTVANNLVTQTAKVEKHSVGGSQTRSVGGSESVSVKQAYFVSVGSQSAAVGGTQKIYVKGDMAINVGSETVTIGGSLVEKVGNPASGAANLGSAALLSGAGALGKAGQLFAAAAPLAKGAVDGFHHGGAKGAAASLGMGLFGMAVGQVPAGDAVMSAISGAAKPAPWKESHEGPGDAAAGGGAGGAASNASGAKGPGPGHRNTQVNGAMMEVIGALHGIMTPGSIGWTTTGASTFVVGGSHSTRTASSATKIMGGSQETLGSLRIKSGGILSRGVKGALSTTIAGAFTSTAGGKHVVAAGGSLKLKVGGSLTMDGSHVVFLCGSSAIAASPGGVLIQASDITITGASKQSGKASHK